MRDGSAGARFERHSASSHHIRQALDFLVDESDRDAPGGALQIVVETAAAHLAGANARLDVSTRRLPVACWFHAQPRSVASAPR